jgi:ketosteroid isomerase-like protein
VASWRRHGGRWQVAALMHSPAVKAPTAPPVDSPLLAGYHGTPPGHPRGDQRRGVMAADRAFAAEALALAPVSGYGQAFVDWADPGAVVFGGRNFYWGIDWVKAIYLTTVAGEYLTWGPTQGDAAESGDLGWTIGTAAYHFSDPSGTYDDYETYLTIWARQADGSWRWLLDDGNLRPAPTP